MAFDWKVEGNAKSRHVIRFVVNKVFETERENYKLKK